MKRILYYNWIQFDNYENKGGGVNVYQRNLIEELIATHSTDVEVYFLSAGREYDFSHNDMYLKKTKNIYGDRCRSFSIVNSPIVSPASFSFSDIKSSIMDESILNLIVDFVRNIGCIDIIHFNNLEGLPVHIFKLKSYFPNIKIVYSLHNYFPFCPQVNLWRKNQYNCKKINTDGECFDCMAEYVPLEKIKRKMAMHTYLEEHPLERLEKAYSICGQRLDEYYSGYKCTTEKENEEKYYLNKYRESYVENINQYVDIVLAVSRRVKEIAVEMGINENKVKVSYIGSNIKNIEKKKKSNTNFKLAYMGYMRNDKGFFFLLDMLEAMPLSLAKNIELIIAAKKNSEDALKRLDQLSEKFYGLKYYDGYTRENQKDILNSVDLGIVPVLWEDNLPQVAIEMTACNVPILTSNLGGASELADNEVFCFEAGNIQQCILKIKYLYENRIELDTYWNSYRGLISMNEHVNELLYLYGIGDEDEHITVCK